LEEAEEIKNRLAVAAVKAIGGSGSYATTIRQPRTKATHGWRFVPANDEKRPDASGY
jgi:hypothetical protein